MEFREYSPEIEKLIIENQALIAHIIKTKYHPSCEDFDDYFSIGMIGLVKAAMSFDETTGTKFSTYAGKVINNEILMYLRKIKKQRFEVSLDSPVYEDDDSEILTLDGTIAYSSLGIQERLELINDAENVLFIILNILTPIQKIALLFYIAEVPHRIVAPIFGFSRSYISRIIKSAKTRTKKALNSNINFKEADIGVKFFDDKFLITFSRFDQKSFKKILAKIADFDVTCELSGAFKVSYLEDQVKLYLYKDKNPFLFLALFFTLYEGYSLECYSDITELLKQEDDII